MMKIAIIGAGPAGIFATKFLKQWDGEIHLFEANDHIGKKLALTGGGRMNLTNKDLTVEHFFSENKRALTHIFKSNFARNYLDLFDELEVKMKWENNRALLESENAAEQVQQWENDFQKQKNLILHLSCSIESIQKNEDKFLIKERSKTEKIFDMVLIATGGMLRLLKEQDEQGIYSLPQSINHTIIKPRPCLSPIKIPNTPFMNLAGTSVEVKLQQGKASITDRILFTHEGISGPVVLDFSAAWDGKEFEINFISTLLEEAFGEEFQALRNGKHALRKLLLKYLPKRVAEFHIKQINGEEKIIADMKKDDLKKLQQNLFHWKITNGALYAYEQSWTTRGGVSLDEINAATMESKLAPNLFFAGEIIDVNGLCGGYNITFAAISARMVCETIKKRFTS